MAYSCSVVSGFVNPRAEFPTFSKTKCEKVGHPAGARFWLNRAGAGRDNGTGLGSRRERRREPRFRDTNLAADAEFGDFGFVAFFLDRFFGYGAEGLFVRVLRRFAMAANHFFAGHDPQEPVRRDFPAGREWGLDLLGADYIQIRKQPLAVARLKRPARSRRYKRAQAGMPVPLTEPG